MKILVLPYTHTLSHISRPLAIAVELRKRGHEVIFAGDSSKDHFIKSAGFDVLPTYQIKPDTLFGRIRKGELKFVRQHELEKLIAADRKLFQEVKPDLVLSDGRFSAPISTGIENLKHAAIVNVSSTEYRALPYIPFFEWLPKNILNRKTRVWKLLDRINLFLEMLVFDNGAGIFKNLSRKYSLKKRVTATNCLAGNDLTLLADLEEYFPTRNLPDSYHYIGPLTWESSLAQPDWWPPTKNNALLAYFTMGSTWMGGSFASLYNMIRKHEITAIISTGGQTKEVENQRMRSIEGEIYVEEFVNGQLVMQECDVVVCHGGNGTIYQALQNGRPIIGIPTIPDQKFNMRRVEALGVGIMITLDDLEKNPEKLFDAIQLILDTPSYREKAEAFRLKLQGTNPAAKAADLIERYFSS